jgi:hypothetical protein
MSKENPIEKPKETKKLKKIKPEENSPLENLVVNGIGHEKEWKDNVPMEQTGPTETRKEEEKNKTDDATDVDNVIGKETGATKKSKRKKTSDRIEEKIGLTRKKKQKIKTEPIRILRTEELEGTKPNTQEEKITEEPKTVQKVEIPKNEKSRIEKLKDLGFKDLTAKIEIYVANTLLRIKNEGLNSDNVQEELEKILEMEKVADSFLETTIRGEYYNIQYSKEEIDKFYNDLKIAKEKLLNLREKINPDVEVEITENGETKEIEEKIDKSTEILAKNKEFEELTEKINIYIKENRNKKTDKKQTREELEKIKEMGDKAGYFLANAELFAKSRRLRDEEIIKMCGDLKNARNELRKLYIEIANQNIEPQLAKDILANWPEEELTKYDLRKEEESKQNTNTKEKEQEFSAGVSEGFTIGEKTTSKDKLTEINKAIKDKELDIEIAEQKMAIYRPVGGLFRKKPVVRDLGYYGVESDLKKLNAELEALKKAKAEIEFGPKNEKLEKLEATHRIYSPAGWHKEPAVKDMGYYDRDKRIAELRADIKKIEKEKGKNKKEQDNTDLEKELEEVVIFPKEKKQGLFARIFGRKEKKTKEPKILSEKEILKSIKPMSKKWRRRNIDSREGQDRFRKT